MPRFVPATVLLFPVFLLCADAGEARPKPLTAPVRIGTLPKVIDESSGIIKSKRFADKDVYWTHNDSGDTSRIFAIDSTGKLLRTVDLKHAANADWEEITMDEQGRLVVCDIGDNNRDNHHGKRMGVVLYRLAEPDPFNADEKPPRPEAFHFDYPKEVGPQNAEGCFVKAGNAYLFTKEIEGSSCFKLPLPEKAPEGHSAMALVTRTRTFNIVTGAALSEDGKHLALINYLTLLVIDFPEPFEALKPNASGQIAVFDFPRRSVTSILGQTEGVCWDKNDLVLTTEGGGVFRSKEAIAPDISKKN
jgi:hypothetical protein